MAKETNIPNVIELINAFAASPLNEIDFNCPDYSLKLTRQAEVSVQAVSAPVYQAAIPAPAPAPVAAAPAPVAPAAPAAAPVAEAPAANQITIKSSMVGTFYRSSSPDNPPFISIGDTITKGQTIGIIEAMKLFNEIESEFAGKVVKILVENATPVEFDQPLVILEV